ncbi:helix-turn-helix domain-containing protein [Streptomyces sp. rh34]|uniref:helix-turn-helix domain-containing protein n=1 Tax=Streptomyces sp. rh34 TaxID=2034272 RepID=UPI000D1BBD52|nr:helix-turn-helix domain-containing protein [Streptomyces sp. rh34]
MPRALTDEQVEEVRALYAQGVRTVEIAERYGVSRPTVLKAVPAEERRPRGPWKPFTEAEEVVAKYRSGQTIVALAEAYGVDTTKIRRILIDAGVERRPAKPPALDLPAKEIADAYRSGKTLRAIAAVYGVTPDPIRRVLAEQGVETRSTGYAPSLSSEQKEEARRLREQGASTLELAERFSVSRAVMQAAVRGVRGPNSGEKTRQTDAEIVAAYERGVSIQELARRNGMAHPTVTKVLKDAGVALRGRGAPRKGLPEHEILERANSGEKLTDLAKAYGISDPTLRRVLREGGFRFQRSR